MFICINDTLSRGFSNGGDRADSRPIKIRIAAALLTALILFSALFTSGTEKAYAEESIYVHQKGRGYCTLASAVMMMRSKAKMEGNSTWMNITQNAVERAAWTKGLKHEFTFNGIGVTYHDLGNTVLKEAFLIGLLAQHPEGIEVYARSKPKHAVFLTRYDPVGGIFYCADPNDPNPSEIPLSQSYNGRSNGRSQKLTVMNLNAVWTVSSYNGQAIPFTGGDAYVSGAGTPGIMGDSSVNAGSDIIHGSSPNFDPDKTMDDFEKRYGWKKDRILARRWEDKVNGKDTQFERQAGSQTDMWLDNMETTQKYLEMGSTDSGTDRAAEFVAEVKREYEKGPGDSNRFLEWFFGNDRYESEAWDTIFISYCADQCGLITDGTFKKTASARELYEYLTGRGCISFEITDLSMFGGEYTPKAGDIFFASSGGKDGIYHSGAVVSSSGKSFDTVEGDYNNEISQNRYDSDLLLRPEYADAYNGFIVSVNYPAASYGSIPLSGGGTCGTIPTVYNGVRLGTYATYEVDLGTYRPWMNAKHIQGQIRRKWAQAGGVSVNGLNTLNGYYLVALTSKYGNVGDQIDFTFSNGKVIRCIKIDAKAETWESWDHNPANEWGHEKGAVILEFCGNPHSGSIYKKLGVYGAQPTAWKNNGSIM